MSSSSFTLLLDSVSEQWVSGTYIVSGVFTIPCASLTIDDVESNRSALYEAVNSARRGRWPRGIRGTYLFPVYISGRFDEEVIRWVQRRRPYKWAIWHEPLLFDTFWNILWRRADYGSYGSAFRSHILEIQRQAMIEIANSVGNPFPEINPD